MPLQDRWADFPLDTLNIGDSLFFKDTTKTAIDQRLFKWRLENDKKIEKKFKVVATKEGVTIWRVEKTHIRIDYAKHQANCNH